MIRQGDGTPVQIACVSDPCKAAQGLPCILRSCTIKQVALRLILSSSPRHECMLLSSQTDLLLAQPEASGSLLMNTTSSDADSDGMELTLN